MTDVTRNYPVLPHFRFWCQKVLPLVYDDSLSYYEVLCKVVKYINDLIDQDKIFADEIDELKKELEIIQNWIDNFDTTYAEQIIKDYLAKMIWVEINDAGYFVYNIPQEWADLKFNTTGYDIDLDIEPEYGHLVISMFNGKEA